MVANNFAAVEPIMPREGEQSLARESCRRLSHFTKHNLRIRVADNDETITLPATAVRLLVETLKHLAAGQSVMLVPIQSELTTQEAADLLGVSRPFLIKQLLDGRIPYRKVGTHRRVQFKDLMAYKQEFDAGRVQSADEATAPMTATLVTPATPSAEPVAAY